MSIAVLGRAPGTVGVTADVAKPGYPLENAFAWLNFFSEVNWLDTSCLAVRAYMGADMMCAPSWHLGLLVEDSLMVYHQ